MPTSPSRTRDAQTKYRFDYNLKIRVKVLDSLGNRCVVCGFTDARALQIDHVNGGGCRELRTSGGGTAYYLSVIRSVQAGEGKYQLLCANCNWIKRSERKENKQSRFSPERLSPVLTQKEAV